MKNSSGLHGLSVDIDSDQAAPQGFPDSWGYSPVQSDCSVVNSAERP